MPPIRLPDHTAAVLPPATSTADLRFFDSRARIEQGENRLPHWHQAGVVCFVSFRLADSIPQEQLRAWTAERRLWLSRNPPPHTPAQEREHDEQFTGKIEAWLDQGAGSCALREISIRECVRATLLHYDGVRYDHHAWVVMPNHVHVLFSPVGEHTIESLVRSWKGISARVANRLHGRTGEFWMRDYYDRLVRDAGHFWRCARYIRRNPEKAKLSPDHYTLYEAPFVREQLHAQGIGGTPAAGLNEPQPRRQECRRSV